MIELLGVGIGWLLGRRMFHRRYPEPRGIFETDEEYLDFIKLLIMENQNEGTENK